MTIFEGINGIFMFLTVLKITLPIPLKVSGTESDAATDSAWTVFRKDPDRETGEDQSCGVARGRPEQSFREKKVFFAMKMQSKTNTRPWPWWLREKKWSRLEHSGSTGEMYFYLRGSQYSHRQYRRKTAPGRGIARYRGRTAFV